MIIASKIYTRENFVLKKILQICEILYPYVIHYNTVQYNFTVKAKINFEILKCNNNKVSEFDPPQDGGQLVLGWPQIHTWCLEDLATLIEIIEALSKRNSICSESS